MDKAKRARTAETPKQPSLGLKLRAPYLYPDRAYSTDSDLPELQGNAVVAVFRALRQAYPCRAEHGD
jgi:hypothetical protein